MCISWLHVTKLFESTNFEPVAPIKPIKVAGSQYENESILSFQASKTLKLDWNCKHGKQKKLH